MSDFVGLSQKQKWSKRSKLRFGLLILAVKLDWINTVLVVVLLRWERKEVAYEVWLEI
jgi:hypothetical protein